MTRAIVTVIVLAGVFSTYGVFVAPLLPDTLAVLVSVIAVPGLVGVIAYWTLRNTPKAIAWLLLIPVLIPLPALLYLGADPAKPGVEWLVYFALVFFVALGEAATALVCWLINRKKDPQHVQA